MYYVYQPYHFEREALLMNRYFFKTQSYIYLRVHTSFFEYDSVKIATDCSSKIFYEFSFKNTFYSFV